MTEPYHVFARRFRPQNFSSVLGQEAIVTTMKNGLKTGRLAHAYLFSGARGTGKTSLARLFAKAMNCQSPLENGEPCNICSSCKEITEGRSLDVIEIDGASHRGIDDIRAISDSVSYAPASGKYKIYLIDEVHMLTKEAFNALLKTLEEPPPNVKFFFATTEPHKVLPTIVSRCQRFNLKRLSPATISDKLSMIATTVGLSVHASALQRIANYAEGGLRDAESMFDQVVAFSDGVIDEKIVQEVLGLSPMEWFSEIDRAIETVRYETAFQIVDRLFMEGKDIGYFIHDLSEHYTSFLRNSEKKHPLLSSEELAHILDLIARAHVAIKSAPSSRIIIEWLLTGIVQIRLKIPLSTIVRKLFDLEKSIAASTPTLPDSQPKVLAPLPNVVEKKSSREEEEKKGAVAPSPLVSPQLEKRESTTHTQKPRKEEEKNPSPPVPSAPLSKKEHAEAQPTTLYKERRSQLPSDTEGQEKGRQESVMNFASVELEGTLVKKNVRQ